MLRAQVISRIQSQNPETVDMLKCLGEIFDYHKAKTMTDLEIAALLTQLVALNFGTYWLRLMKMLIEEQSQNSLANLVTWMEDAVRRHPAEVGLLITTTNPFDESYLPLVATGSKANIFVHYKFFSMLLSLYIASPATAQKIFQQIVNNDERILQHLARQSHMTILDIFSRFKLSNPKQYAPFASIAVALLETLKDHYNASARHKVAKNKETPLGYFFQQAAPTLSRIGTKINALVIAPSLPCISAMKVNKLDSHIRELIKREKCPEDKEVIQLFTSLCHSSLSPTELYASMVKCHERTYGLRNSMNPLVYDQIIEPNIGSIIMHPLRLTAYLQFMTQLYQRCGIEIKEFLNLLYTKGICFLILESTDASSLIASTFLRWLKELKQNGLISDDALHAFLVDSTYRFEKMYDYQNFYTYLMSYMMHGKTTDVLFKLHYEAVFELVSLVNITKLARPELFDRIATHTTEATQEGVLAHIKSLPDTLEKKHILQRCFNPEDSLYIYFQMKCLTYKHEIWSGRFQWGSPIPPKQSNFNVLAEEHARVTKVLEEISTPLAVAAPPHASFLEAEDSLEQKSPFAVADDALSDARVESPPLFYPGTPLAAYPYAAASAPPATLPLPSLANARPLILFGAVDHPNNPSSLPPPLQPSQYHLDQVNKPGSKGGG